MDARERAEAVRLATRNYFATSPLVLFGAPVAAYLIGLILGLEGDQIGWTLLVPLPAVVATIGFVLPLAILRYHAVRAFARRPGEPREARLARLLGLPARATFHGGLLCWLAGAALFTGWVCVHFDKSPWLSVLGAVVGVGFGALQTVAASLSFETLVRPHALEELERSGAERVAGRGFFWPRQRWYLPFVLGVLVLCTLAFTSIVVGVKYVRARDVLQAELAASAGPAAAQAVLRSSDAFARSLVFPLAIVGGFMLVSAGVSAWVLVRRQVAASRAILDSLESLLGGAPRPPAWVSTDEMGDLTFGTRAFLSRLRELPASLQASAQKLAQAGATLSVANEDQSRSVTRQAAALQETQVTAQELKQVLTVAADKAEAVLQVAARAEDLGRQGASAVEQSLHGLGEIRQITEDIRQQIGRLEERAKQVEDITDTVKHLADQTNMLALNAAIEAVRSGEHGKGFGVVAREIRNLADQSIEANQRVREILEDIGGAIREAVAMSDKGSRHIENELRVAHASGDDLRELSAIVGESAAAVRQISAAVSQQNAGFAQIFGALAELGTNMDDTVRRLDATRKAASSLESASRQVDEIARRYAAG